MDKELIDHIATQLQNHEEQYVPGAWERFEKKEKKRRGLIYWPLWSAAILALILGALFFSTNKPNFKQDLVETKTPSIIPQQKQNILESDQELYKSNQNALNNNGKKESVITLNNKNERFANNQVADDHSILEVAISPLTIALNQNMLDNKIIGINLSSSEVRDFELAMEKKKTILPKKSFEDLLAFDSQPAQQKNNIKREQESKWQPGVYVAPAMGNDNKVNMNYGFSLSYAIANKLSISSGVSYSAMSTKENLNTGVPQTLSGRNLESVDAKVRGINIPLELKYNISDKLYTGVGISALAVINNNQQNTYIENQVQSSVVSDASGYSTTKNYIVAEKTSEPQPAASLDPDKYIGFYNFSLGYKQKISPKKNIAIEPFLRLPMKSFSKENLNLSNGGLRLKIDF